MFQTPILFLIFNRQDTATQVFTKIREIKPAYLYIAADGPREGKEGEIEICYKTKKIILNSIDWDCEVKTLFRKENLGCGLAVSEAITWFFENVEEGIILEDDCLPDLSFFEYSEVLLEKFRFDSEIYHIAGNLPINNSAQTNYTYFFSKYSLIWGWATWRRAWESYKYRIDFSLENINIIRGRFSKHSECEYWLKCFERIYFNKINTWDYQWFFNVLISNGKAVLPTTNLVYNIGLYNNSTHEFKNFIQPEVNESLKFENKAAINTFEAKISEKFVPNYKHSFRSFFVRIYRWTRVITFSDLFLKTKPNNFNFEKLLIKDTTSILYDTSRVFNFSEDNTKITVGYKCHIRGDLLVFPYGGKIEIGNFVFIGEQSRIWSGERIKIGSNVLISHNVNIIDTSSHEMNSTERACGFYDLIEFGQPKVQGSIKTNEIIIEDNVWINMNVTILSGVTIGKGAIIGANALVNKNVEPFTFVAGNPARFIKFVQ